MTEDEWARIAALIDGLWKDEFDKTRESSFFMVLAPFDAIDVYAAVIECTDEDRPFAPSIGELKARLRVSVNPSQVPSYEKAMQSLYEVAQRVGANGQNQGLRSLELEHPFLTVLAKRIGWGYLYYRRNASDETFTRQVYDAVIEECSARRESYVKSLAGAPLYLGLPQGPDG
jgi:hypothetical protein